MRRKPAPPPTLPQRQAMERIADGDDLFVTEGISGGDVYSWLRHRTYLGAARPATVNALLRLGWIRWRYARPGELRTAIVTPAGHRALAPPKRRFRVKFAERPRNAERTSRARRPTGRMSFVP